MKIYLAGPLFSESERGWLSEIRDRIEKVDQGISVIWPYELIPPENVNSSSEQGKQEIFQICKSYLDKVDVLVCVLDGPQVDDGTAWEIGYFYCMHANKLPIIGIRTDFRNAGETEHSIVNAMIEGSCSKIVHSSEELFEVLRQQVR